MLIERKLMGNDISASRQGRGAISQRQARTKLGSFHGNDVARRSGRLDVIILGQWENARLLLVFQGPFNKVSADARLHGRKVHDPWDGAPSGQPTVRWPVWEKQS